MPPRPTNWLLYGKMAAAGAICCFGGPALIYYVSPTEEELFLKYNPELQKRSLENRAATQQDFDDFVGRLKEYSKSDRPIWEAKAIAEKKARAAKIVEQVKLSEEIEARKKEMRNAGIKPMPGGSL
ncbi:CBP4-domain-containing protein [Stipitochalara longipes BDJ]|nr:CBP4-domain-containing protein [Stipitochalara longipes BDJ]